MQRSQLKETLSSLVKAFGHKKVQNALDSLGTCRTIAPERDKAYEKNRAEGAVHAKSKKQRDAIAIVNAFGLTDKEKAKLLVEMARRYEARQFMPNVGHARAFLQSRGIDVSFVKSRRQTTAAVFKNLAELETPVLRDILDGGQYDPPMRLGPIADAIDNYGQWRRSQS